MPSKKIGETELIIAHDLASQGMGRVSIAEELGVNPRTTYKGILGQSIMEGYQIARKSVLTDYLTLAQTDPKLMEKLVERLGVFRQVIDIDKPTKIEDIPKFMETGLQKYLSGEISKSQLEVLETWASRYAQAVKDGELGEIVDDLLARLENLEARHGKFRT